MSRLSLILALAAVCLLSYTASSAVSDWPTFHQSHERKGYHDGYSNTSFSKFDLLWNYTTGGPVQSSPAVADVTGDETQEIVVGSDDGNIYMFDSRGKLLWKYRTNDSVRSSPTISDIDLDGSADIVVGSSDGSLYALHKNGSLMWKFTADGPITVSPTLYDLADTKNPEIIFGTSGNTLYVLDYEGHLQFNYTIPGGVSSSATIADADSDGKKEIVLGSNNNFVYIFDYPPSLHWDYYVAGSNILASPLKDENLIIAAENGRIIELKQTTFTGEQPKYRKCNATRGSAECHREEYVYTRYVLDANYSLLENYSLQTDTQDAIIKGTPALAKLNTDRIPEVIVPSMYEGRLYILDLQDQRFNKIVGVYTTEGAIESSPAVADFNRDGLKDIVFGSNDKKLYIIDANLTKIIGADSKTHNYTYTRTRWVYSTGGPIRSSPAVSDINNNLDLEVIVGSDDGNLYVFGDKYRWVRQQADELYEKAYLLYEENNITPLEEKLNQASELYLQIDDNDGIDKVNFLQKRMLGDSLVLIAEDYYSKSDYYNASETIHKAALVYRYINDGAGLLKVYAFLNSIRVDSLLKEVDYYIDAGDYDTAAVIAERAKNYSQSIRQSDASNKTAATLSKIGKTLDANKVYIQALKLYHNKTYSQETYDLLERARALYLEANYSDGIVAVDTLTDTMSADRYYATAVLAYNQSVYKNASDSALKALDLYSRINHSSGIEKARQLAENSALYVRASKFYADAETYYLATDFFTAVELSSQARENYARIPDAKGATKSELLLNKSLLALKAQTKVEIPFALKILLAFTSLIALLRLRVLWSQKGKPSPKRIIKFILRTPTKLENAAKKRRHERDYHRRYEKPAWTTLSELRSRELGFGGHPARWFKKNTNHPSKLAKQLRKPLALLHKKTEKPEGTKAAPEEEESLAEQLDEEIRQH